MNKHTKKITNIYTAAYILYTNTSIMIHNYMRQNIYICKEYI